MAVHKSLLVGQWGGSHTLESMYCYCSIAKRKNRKENTTFLERKLFFFSFELNAFIFSYFTLQHSEQFFVFLFATENQLPAEQLEAFSSPQPDHGAAELP